MCVHAQKHAQMCFGRAEMEVATVLALIAFPFPRRWHRASPLASLGWLYMFTIYGSPCWPFKQHDVSMDCAFSALGAICQHGVSLFVTSHPPEICHFCICCSCSEAWGVFSTAVRYKRHDTVYCNQKNSSVSQITHWEIPITVSEVMDSLPGSDNIHFIQKHVFSINLKDSLIAHQIKNKCLRLTLISFHNMGPIKKPLKCYRLHFLICSLC